MIVISLNLFLGILFKNFLFFFWILSLPFILTLIISILLLIVREIFYQATPGANDNASGVCVMLNLAEEISNSPFEKTEIYFLATGAEEVGMIGMLKFLKKHKNKYKNAYFINLDNLGSGDLRYVLKEGMLKTYNSCKELKYIAENVIFENNLKIKPFIYKTMATDGYALLVRGFKTMSIVGADEKGLLPNWHWVTDTLENIKVENIKDCQKFVIEMIKKIDRK
jgi:putative aminopeptidase FrvX